MSSKNKRNILYFKGKTMQKLYERMQAWQKKHNKRFLSISIQKDGDMFCAIALTNPSEVVITNLDGTKHADLYFQQESGLVALATSF
jgi:hypothetical protein